MLVFSTVSPLKKIKQKTKTKQKNTAGYLKYSISIGSRHSKQTGRIYSFIVIYFSKLCVLGVVSGEGGVDGAA